ncbi:hypothetical protein [Vibrio alginolyticus]
MIGEGYLIYKLVKLVPGLRFLNLRVVYLQERIYLNKLKIKLLERQIVKQERSNCAYKNISARVRKHRYQIKLIKNDCERLSSTLSSLQESNYFGTSFKLLIYAYSTIILAGTCSIFTWLFFKEVSERHKPEAYALLLVIVFAIFFFMLIGSYTSYHPGKVRRALRLSKKIFTLYLSVLVLYCIILFLITLLMGSNIFILKTSWIPFFLVFQGVLSSAWHRFFLSSHIRVL